jgi:hypothetical protein
MKLILMCTKEVYPIYFILVFCCFLGSGCVKDSPEKPLPPALGKLNELTIVMDTIWWQGKIGAEVRENFSRAFPFVTPAEPLFKTQYYSPNRFLTTPSYLAQRNCLIIIRKYSSNPQEQALAKIIESRLSQEQLKQWRDNQVFAMDKVWSDPQRVMVVAVNEEKQVLQLWEQFYPTIYQRIRENETHLLESTLFKKKPDNAINRKLWENHKVDLDLPRGTQIVSSNDSITWLQYPYPEGGALWLLIRRATVAELARSSQSPEVTLQGILRRSPAPAEMYGGGGIRLEEKKPPLFSSTIRYQKTIPATEWRGLWLLGAKTGSFIGQLPDFPRDAPVLLAGFVEGGQSDKVTKLLELQFLLQRQRTEMRP